jgi:hypothetical protein
MFRQILDQAEKRLARYKRTSLFDEEKRFITLTPGRYCPIRFRFSCRRSRSAARRQKVQPGGAQ